MDEANGRNNMGASTRSASKLLSSRGIPNIWTKVYARLYPGTGQSCLIQNPTIGLEENHHHDPRGRNRQT